MEFTDRIDKEEKKRFPFLYRFPASNQGIRDEYICVTSDNNNPRQTVPGTLSDNVGYKKWILASLSYSGKPANHRFHSTRERFPTVLDCLLIYTQQSSSLKDYYVLGSELELCVLVYSDNIIIAIKIFDEQNHHGNILPAMPG